MINDNRQMNVNIININSQTQMLPNQFCYQIPMQFFTPPTLSQIMPGTQNYNTLVGYPFNHFLPQSIIPTAIQNNGNFFNYIPCQMQFPNLTTQSDQEQKIAVLVNPTKEINHSSQIQKHLIEGKINQAQKVITEGCICSKTGCVKEYCRCFKNGKACTDECRCHQCRNLIDSQIQVKKKIKSSKGTKCNCKKSKCSNKYCDCLVAGVSCGKQCNCCGCSNH